MSQQSTLRVSHVRTVGMPVTDKDRALDFYLGVLGLEKRIDAPLPQLGGRWIDVWPAGATTACHAEFRARGTDVGELLTWPGVPPMFSLRDPDGNGLEIVE
jgi:lactoylglutathione lyase